MITLMSWQEKDLGAGGEGKNESRAGRKPETFIILLKFIFTVAVTTCGSWKWCSYVKGLRQRIRTEITFAEISKQHIKSQGLKYFNTSLLVIYISME